MSTGSIDKKLLEILACPVSGGGLIEVGAELWCRESALAYPIDDGLPIMLESESRQLSAQEMEQLRSK